MALIPDGLKGYGKVQAVALVLDEDLVILFVNVEFRHKETTVKNATSPY